MALAKVFTVDAELVNGIPVGTGGVPGTEYVAMYGQTAQEFNVSAVRVNTVSGSGAYYPSNGTITWRLRRVAGTNSGILVGTATANPIGQSTTAAQSTWYYSTTSGLGTATFATMGQVAVVPDHAPDGRRQLGRMVHPRFREERVAAGDRHSRAHLRARVGRLHRRRGLQSRAGHQRIAGGPPEGGLLTRKA